MNREQRIEKSKAMLKGTASALAMGGVVTLPEALALVTEAYEEERGEWTYTTEKVTREQLPFWKDGYEAGKAEVLKEGP